MSTRKFGGASGRHRVGETAHPAVRFAAVGRGGVPVGHRGEVRERRILVAAAVHDGELAALVEALETRHAGAEAEVVVDDAQLLARDAEIWPVLVVGVVGVGHQRVQAVVTARQLEHNQNFPIRLGFGGECGSRLAEQCHAQRRTRAHAHAAHARAQQIAPAGFRKFKIILVHSPRSSTELILGLAHDHVQCQPQRVFHVSLGSRDVAGAQFLV